MNKTIPIRIAITAVLAIGGLKFPWLFLPAAWVAWTIFDSLRNPPPPEPDEWLARRWTTTAQDPRWKSDFLRFCESPAETAFLEAMITVYDLLPEKGVLKGGELTSNLQVKVPPYRLDFLANGWLAIEIDGATYHSSVEAVVRDRDRDRFLEQSGYSVLRIPAKVVFDKPQQAVDRVRATIAAGRKHVVAAAREQGKVSPGRSLLGGLAVVDKIVADASSFIKTAAAVQQAMKQAELTFADEKIAIEFALKHATGQLEVERIRAQSESHRESFDKSYAQIQALLGCDEEPFTMQIAPIVAPPPHADPRIDETLQAAHQSLMRTRSRYFDEVRSELEANPSLAKLVEIRLREIGCAGTWNTVS